MAQTIFIELKIIPKRGLLPPSKNDIVQPSDLMKSWIWDILMNLKVLHLYIGHQKSSGTSTNWECGGKLGPDEFLERPSTINTEP